MAPKKAAPRVQENVQLGPQVREGQSPHETAHATTDIGD